MTTTSLAELPGGYRVLRATAEHLSAIVALLADDPLGSGREDASDPAYARAFAQIDADPAHLLVAVVDPDGEVAGTMQLSFVPGLSRRGMLRAQVEAVRIAATARGAGLGEAFFGWAIDYAREQGAGMVQLTTDKSRSRARSFYERLGFVASHEGMKLTLVG